MNSYFPKYSLFSHGSLHASVTRGLQPDVDLANITQWKNHDEVDDLQTVFSSYQERVCVFVRFSTFPPSRTVSFDCRFDQNFFK